MSKHPDQSPVERAHAQFLLDVVAAEERRRLEEDPLLEVLRRAQQAEVEKEEQE